MKRWKKKQFKKFFREHAGTKRFVFINCGFALGLIVSNTITRQESET